MGDIFILISALPFNFILLDIINIEVYIGLSYDMFFLCIKNLFFFSKFTKILLSYLVIQVLQTS